MLMTSLITGIYITSLLFIPTLMHNYRWSQQVALDNFRLSYRQKVFVLEHKANMDSAIIVPNIES